MSEASNQQHDSPAGTTAGSPPQKEKEYWEEPEYQRLFTELSFNAGLETDRQLLTLSSAGLALLVGLLSAKTIDSPLLTVLFVLSGGGFVFAIYTLVDILDRNKTHINKIAGGGDSHCPLLAALEVRAKRAFLFSAIGVLVIGLFISVKGASWEITTKETKSEPQESRSLTVPMNSASPQGKKD
ncbi:hypothetical protein [Comamonas sp. 17RB]|uniref:hypothetical protein n=1 Tax=Comamonas sp. 17RB TaxID=3047025 RepID=UPI0024B656AA|nr:hypothetical protein [Comamonas sp. 17RB]MDI9856144.1 hypothetical protein [Comamonas sp. 17RB]